METLFQGQQTVILTREGLVLYFSRLRLLQLQYLVMIYRKLECGWRQLTRHVTHSFTQCLCLCTGRRLSAPFANVLREEIQGLNDPLTALLFLLSCNAEFNEKLWQMYGQNAIEAPIGSPNNSAFFEDSRKSDLGFIMVIHKNILLLFVNITR